METEQVQYWIEDFSTFCVSVDVKAVVAAADDEGNAPGWDKQLYAIAIVRALHQGVLGGDWLRAQYAVALLWERGHRRGFDTDSFNGVLRDLGKPAPSRRTVVYPRPMPVFDSAVGG